MVKGFNFKKSKIHSFPRDTLEQAIIAKKGWSKVGKKLLVPNLTIDEFFEKINEAENSVEKAEKLKLERSKAIQNRNKSLSELWDLTKRIRNAAKATFGDSSNELQLLISTKREEQPKN